MRHVKLRALLRAVTPQEALEGVIRFERYAELAPHVQSSVVHTDAATGAGRSSWELHFRSGLLRWSESETVDRERLLVSFEQDGGDFEQFRGQWQIAAEGSDSTVAFDADFDFGIPSLEGILNPIAERVITETVAWALNGLFSDVGFSDHIDLVPGSAAGRV
jgi:ribosome-associated toxin RatA of RatAB toxin-antitoxin module